MRQLLPVLLTLSLAVAPSSTALAADEVWLGSEALRLTIGNGINSGVSFWRSAEGELAELRVVVLTQGEPSDATAVMLRVGDTARALPCSPVRRDITRIEGRRSCFANFPGFTHGTTISRCPLAWDLSQRILDGAPVEIQVDTEWKLLKRKRLSKKQLAKLTTLEPIED